MTPRLVLTIEVVEVPLPALLPNPAGYLVGDVAPFRYAIRQALQDGVVFLCRPRPFYQAWFQHLQG